MRESQDKPFIGKLHTWILESWTKVSVSLLSVHIFQECVAKKRALFILKF